MAVRDNTKAGNSVKQTSSVLHIRGCVHLPLQQFFKIIMSPDSTFYKLHSDIYFAKVLSQAMLVRTIFRKTLLKVYSNLKVKVKFRLKTMSNAMLSSVKHSPRSLCPTFLLLPHFDIICAQLLNSKTHNNIES